MTPRLLELAWLGLATLPALCWGGEAATAVSACELVLLACGLALVAAPGLAVRPAPSGVARALGAGLALAVVATVAGDYRAGALAELSWWLALACLWRLVQGLLDSAEAFTRLQVATVAAGALVGLIGLYSTFSGADTVMGLAKTAYRGQVSGTFVNPSHMASYLVATLPAAVALAVSHPSLDLRLFGGACAVVEVLAIAYSRSRGGWLATAACAVLLATAAPGPAARRMLRRALVAVTLLAGIGLAATPDALPALSARFDTLVSGSIESTRAFGRLGPWGVAAKLIAARPLTGWGPGSYPLAFLSQRPPGYYYRPSHAHMDLLECGVELGAGGLAVAVALVALHAGLGFAAQARAATDPERLAVAATLTGLAAFGLTTLWDWPLHVPADALLVAALAGAVAARAGPPREVRSGVPPVALVAALVALIAGALLVDRLSAEADAARARALERDGEPDAAIALLAGARARWPSAPAFALAEAELCARRAGAGGRAMAVEGAHAAVAAVEAAPGFPDCWRALGGALVTLAFLPDTDAMARADWLWLAQAAFGEAADRDPANHLPHLERANTLWSAGRAEEALASYRAALDAYPVERIGEIPEIATQMAPVATVLAAPAPRQLPDGVVGTALRLLELRKARAPHDFRSYDLLEQLYRGMGLGEDARLEHEDGLRARGAP